MFRGLDPSVWVNACLNQIKSEQPELALVSDVRFENEVRAIQSAGGFVVGLNRNPFKQETDQHVSEVSAQKCLDLCDTIIKNDTLSIPEQNKEIYFAIKHLDNIPEILK